MTTKKPAYSILEQINLLKSRGMFFKDEIKARHFLSTISYYRLKGYWWDMQEDYEKHSFRTDSYFEDVVNRYNFDRHLRIILFDAIERIEIALRTKMIHHFALRYGGLWYLDSSLFSHKQLRDSAKTIHQKTIEDLKKEFLRSKEIFVLDHISRFPNKEPEAWKILEIASLGTLSKLFKNINPQVPEKSIIANEMGLNMHNELSSWLESITYVRNMVAHHSRMWSRNMVKKPIDHLNNPKHPWISNPLKEAQIKKPYLIISTMLYLCNQITPNHQIKQKLLSLFNANPSIPIYKLGFLNNWEKEPLWQ
jgi:abortive infection bacteriophage resistance protein